MSVLLTTIAIVSGSATVITVAALRFARRVLEMDHELDLAPDRAEVAEAEAKRAAEQQERDRVYMLEAKERDARDAAAKAAAKEERMKLRAKVEQDLRARVAGFKPINSKFAALETCPICGSVGAIYTARGGTDTARARSGSTAWDRLVEGVVEHGSYTHAHQTYLNDEKAQDASALGRGLGPCSIFVIQSADGTFIRWQICLSCGGEWTIQGSYTADALSKTHSSPSGKKYPSEPAPSESQAPEDEGVSVGDISGGRRRKR